MNLPIWQVCANYGKHSGTGHYYICRRCKTEEFPKGCADFKQKEDDMLKFTERNGQIYVYTSQEGLALGYIDNKGIFFPNNNMAFQLEWMLDIARAMQRVKLRRGEIPLACDITAHYEIKEVEL